MLFKKNNCNGCKKNLTQYSTKNYSFFSGILLAILPKCPFCIMAYTSTVMLCGKDTLIERQHNNNSMVSISITAIFCLLILAGLFLNYRGLRTKYALALSGMGILMILNSIIISGGQELYYTGVSLVFIAVWLNGSLLSIIRNLKNFSGSHEKTALGSPYP